jgi:hypothetical protein
MRILDEKTGKAVERVTLYFTRSEASEMNDSLEALLTSPTGRHEHIPSDDYRKEVTICIYDQAALEGFDERSKTLILDDV